MTMKGGGASGWAESYRQSSQDAGRWLSLGQEVGGAKDAMWRRKQGMQLAGAL